MLKLVGVALAAGFVLTAVGIDLAPVGAATYTFARAATRTLIHPWTLLEPT
jgi:hypothetical protein